ncbi:MAG: hypothetical protein ACO1QS_11570 [Verrucomicrobiota bacterium]
MQINSPNPEWHLLKEQVVIRLHELNTQDLNSLTSFAEHRLRRRAELHCPLPAHYGGADLVQTALMKVLQGCNSPEIGRQPRIEDVRSKPEFLSYLGGVVNSLISAEHEPTSLAPAFMAASVCPSPSPAELAEYNNLTAELLKQLQVKTSSMPALQEVLQAWEENIRDGGTVPHLGHYKRAYRVRQLARKILLNLN